MKETAVTYGLFLYKELGVQWEMVMVSYLLNQIRIFARLSAPGRFA